jgi:nucleotide-binding universal stress UspA family protein
LYPNTSHLILSGSPIPNIILDHARKNQFDLIVVGTHGRKGISRLLMGSVTQELIQYSEIPIMVVKAAKTPYGHYQNYNRLLIPVDFSDASMKALDFGINFANLLRADVHLIHCIDTVQIPESIQKTPAHSGMTLAHTCELNVDSSMLSAIKDKELYGDVHSATVCGEPGREICKYAEQNDCGFIVMGSHGKEGLERALVGSVTASVVLRSGIPVITISGKQTA